MTLDEAKAEDRNQHDGEDEVRERPQDIYEPHDQHVHPAAVIPCGHPQDDANRCRQYDRAYPNDHRDASADDDPAEQVAPHVVRSPGDVRWWGQPRSS